MVLVGVQPTLMHVPPTCSRSMMAVLRPDRASALDNGPPLCPAPMTIASYWVVLMHHPLSYVRAASTPLMPYSSWPGRWQMYCWSPMPVNVIVVTRDESAGTLTSVDRVSCTASVPCR